jgi:hypothetical protein
VFSSKEYSVSTAIAYEEAVVLPEDEREFLGKRHAGGAPATDRRTMAERIGAASTIPARAGGRP